MNSCALLFSLIALFSKSSCFTLIFCTESDTTCLEGCQTVTGSATTGCNAITDVAARSFEFATDNDNQFVTMCTTPAGSDDGGCTNTDGCEVFQAQDYLAGGPWQSYQVVVA